MLLVMPQNSQKSTCVRVSLLIKLQPQLWKFIEKRLWHRCLPVNFAKLLRTPFYRTPLGDCFWHETFRKSLEQKFRRAIFVLKIYYVRRDQFNLLVYRLDQPYFNQKQKKAILATNFWPTGFLKIYYYLPSFLKKKKKKKEMKHNKLIQTTTTKKNLLLLQKT